MLGKVFLNRYETIRLLGEGGMGKVYLARQLDLGRQVVVKVMHDHIASDKIFRERFQRESLLMARFQHPYAVALYDASLDDPNGLCIVMEYVRGINMELMLQKAGRFSPPRLSRMLTQLCEVLEAAHEADIVHRDLKPANLMVVDHDSPREKIKVMDFGLAKLIHENKNDLIKNVSSSQVEFAIGTPGYISPEQVRGEDIDHRSDLYSVGVILYEMLVGRLPFLGESTMDVLLAHATEPPPSFADLDPDLKIPKSIEDVVFACLEKDPNNRPQTARELAEYFEMALSFVDEDPASLMETTPEHFTPCLIQDATALSFEMEAWMPESIAVLKMRGFVQDVGGEIVESLPGMLRVKITNGFKSNRSGVFSIFGGNRKNNDLNIELHMHSLHPSRGNQILIQALFRPVHPTQLSDPLWRDCCTSIYIDLRSFLIARTSSFV